MSELAKALAEFQANLPHVSKAGTAEVQTKTGGRYSYTFADLADVSAAALPLLGKYGLSFSSKPTLTDEGRFVLRYSLRHSSGESDGGDYPLPTNAPPQELGSAITYGRRYCLCAVTGIAPDDDDDGAAASRSVHGGRQEEYTVERPRTPAELVADMASVGITGRELGVSYISETLGREVRDDLRDLSPADVRKVYDRLDEEAAAATQETAS